MLRKYLHCLLHDCRGTTIIEFAVIAPIFFLMLMAVFEFGLIMYTQVVLETAVDEAGRDAMVSQSQNGCDRVCQFTADVQNKTARLINGANISVAANTVGAGGTGGVTATPDICLTNPPSTPPTCPTGTPFIDNNGNGVYDGPGAANLGNSGDEVQLLVTLPWAVQFPFVKNLFTATDNSGHAVNGTFLLSATTIIKNE